MDQMCSVWAWSLFPGPGGYPGAQPAHAPGGYLGTQPAHATGGYPGAQPAHAPGGYPEAQPAHAWLPNHIGDTDDLQWDGYHRGSSGK